jgi:hypothetical protein
VKVGCLREEYERMVYEVTQKEMQSLYILLRLLFHQPRSPSHVVDYELCVRKASSSFDASVDHHSMIPRFDPKASRIYFSGRLRANHRHTPALHEGVKTDW